MMKKRILAKDIFVNNNTHETQLNNNDVIVGPSGSGKTRGYVLPNIMQAQESLIITDTKNSLYKQTAGYLQKEGYLVHKIDFTGKTKSTIGYNPMDYIKYESTKDLYDNASILRLSRIIVPSAVFDEPYWNEAAFMLCASIISFIMNETVDKDHTLNSVQRVIQNNGMNLYLRIIQELELKDPNDEAVKLYQIIKAAGSAEKMIGSVFGLLTTSVQALNSENIRNLSKKKNRIWFPDMGEQKTALFVNVSDSDRSTDTIQSIFYSQALQSLLDTADMMPSNHLKVPVRFMFDDFASGSPIKNFDQIISVIRSREVYTSIIIQSLSQLNTIYSPEVAKTILNNCDHMLYLGGQDYDTIQMISHKSNLLVQTISKLPVDECLYFERGLKSRIVKRFDISQHPMFGYLNLHIEKSQGERETAKGKYEYVDPSLRQVRQF